MVNGQNRKSICEYLKNEFENYFVFLEMINTALDTKLNIVEKYKVKNLKNEHSEFNKNIKDGLNNLHCTYGDYEEGAMIISSIILKLQSYIVNEVDEID